MKYLKSTVAYLFKYDNGKRFLTIFLLSLVPSLALGYGFPFSGYMDFLFDIGKNAYADYSSLWIASFTHGTLNLIMLAVAVVLYVFFTAYIATLITRSVRVGEFRLTNVVSSVNENFFPAIAMTAFYIVSTFISHNLFVLFTYLFLFIGSKGLGMTFIVLCFLGLCVLTVYIWSSLTLWLPTMSFSGQYVTKALIGAFYKSRSYQRHFFIPSLLALSFTLLLGVAGHFAGSVWYAKWLINSLCFSVLFTFILSFSSIAYCETESITREDMARRYFGR